MEKKEPGCTEVPQRKISEENIFETISEISHTVGTFDPRGSADLEIVTSNCDSFDKVEENQTIKNVSLDKKSKPLKLIHDNITEQESDPFSTSKSPTSKNQKDSSDLESEMDFSFTKKKKKKKLILLSENLVSAEEEFKIISPLLNDNSPSEVELLDINSDYSYDFLLSRFFDLMREKNCNNDEVGRKKLILRPPQVLRAGTKRTSFANFLELCKIMRRTPQHVQSYLIVELGTNGSIDGNGQLLIKGKFHQKQIENVLRRYIKEYVTCHTCHSPDTVLLKETRLCFLQCEACRSRCSVPVIKSGFQALISKRAAIRAKMI